MPKYSTVRPLIAKYCPLFYDSAHRRGAIDLYSYFKDHPDELLPDGVHETVKGQESWRRIWVHEVGRVIYSDKS